MSYHKGYRTEPLSRMVRAGTVESLRSVADTLGMTQTAVLEKAIGKLSSLSVDELVKFLLVNHEKKEVKSKRG